jgi:tetratricopeptide (TPR) repeat protein
MLNHAIFGGLVLALVAGLCGCQNEADAKKKAFRDNYQKKSAPVKLTAIRGQLNNGQIAEAHKSLQALLAEDSENAFAWTLMGRAWIAQKNLPEAKTCFEKAISLNEPTGDALLGMGVIAQSGDDHTTALDYYQKALDLTPANTECILAISNTLDVLGRSDEAASLLDAKLSIKPSDSTLLMAAAAQAGRSGNTDKAIRLYQRAAAVDPKNTRAMQSLATLYISGGDWASAADVYAEASAVAEESDKEDYLQRQASCSFNAGRFRAALDSYDKLSISQRNSPDIWLGIAQSALGVSDAKRARYAAQKALSLKNDCTEAQLVLGCADYLDGKYLTALELFNRLSADDKAGGFATFMAGRCYMKLGRDKQAQAAFDRATQTAPESPLVSMFLNEKK